MARTLSGYASTWDRDLGDDVIQPGAFTDWLNHWHRTGETLPLVDSHDYSGVSNIIGRLTDARQDERGLWTEFAIASTPEAEAAYSLARDGFLTGLSIGYRPVKWKYTDDDSAIGGRVRQIERIDLREVSTVLFPMNPAARLEPAKAEVPVDDMTLRRRFRRITEREAERRQRETAAQRPLRREITRLLNDRETRRRQYIAGVIAKRSVA